MARNKVDLPEPEGPETKVVVPASIVSRSAHTISRPSGRHNTRSCNTRSRPKCSVRSMRGGFVPVNRLKRDVDGGVAADGDISPEQIVVDGGCHADHANPNLA